MATNVKELMKEFEELDKAYAELQGFRRELKRMDELIKDLGDVNTDYLYALKAVSDKYGSDFEIAAFAAISSLAKTVSTFGAEETLRSLEFARKMRKYRKYKEDKVDK